MKNNLPKIPFSLAIGFLFVSVSVFYFFYTKTNDNNQKTQIAEADWQAEASRREEIRTLDRSLKMLSAERTSLETHFAESKNIVPFLDTIEDLAPSVGVVAEVTSVDIPKEGTVLMAGMKASGSFTGLYKFLTLLENSPYELEFMSMKIDKNVGTAESGKTAQGSTWDLSLKIKLLSFAD